MESPTTVQLLQAIAWLIFAIFLIMLAGVAAALHPELTLVLALLACGAVRGMRLTADATSRE